MIHENIIFPCVPSPSGASLFIELHAQTLYPNFTLYSFSLPLIILHFNPHSMCSKINTFCKDPAQVFNDY